MRTGCLLSEEEGRCDGDFQPRFFLRRGFIEEFLTGFHFVRISDRVSQRWNLGIIHKLIHGPKVAGGNCRRFLGKDVSVFGVVLWNSSRYTGRERTDLMCLSSGIERVSDFQSIGGCSGKANRILNRYLCHEVW